MNTLDTKLKEISKNHLLREEKVKQGGFFKKIKTQLVLSGLVLTTLSSAAIGQTSYESNMNNVEFNKKMELLIPTKINQRSWSDLTYPGVVRDNFLYLYKTHSTDLALLDQNINGRISDAVLYISAGFMTNGYDGEAKDMLEELDNDLKLTSKKNVADINFLLGKIGFENGLDSTLCDRFFLPAKLGVDPGIYVAYLESNEFKSDLSSFEKKLATKLNGMDVNTYLYDTLGKVYEDAKHIAQAKKIYEEAIIKKTQNPEIYDRMIPLTLSDNNAKIKVCLSAIQNIPNIEQNKRYIHGFWQELTYWYYRTDQIDKGKEAEQRMLELK
jgi:tetratricopeptide (TPR) repeat protein